MNKSLLVVIVSLSISFIGALVIDLTSLEVTGVMLILDGLFGILAGPLIVSIDD